MHYGIARCLVKVAVTGAAFLLVAAGTWGCAASSARNAQYDVILRNGLVIDGSGEPGVVADVAIAADQIVAIGDLGESHGDREIDVTGLVVAPGFINMLSWATVSLLADGRALSDLKQGVTLEVMGEGTSMGPLNARLRTENLAAQGEFKYELPWSTLGGYLEHLESRGVSPNIASFVGATTVRKYVVGSNNRAATPTELARMQGLVEQAMQEGALGVGSSLIYAPGNFADTHELTALVASAVKYGGGYISHVRSEGARLVAAVKELVEIAQATGARSELYHLKASGRANWHKLEDVFELIEQGRREGLDLGANIYPYTASATGLDAVMPLWVQEGGFAAWVERLRNPALRARVLQDMRATEPDWENFLLDGPQHLLMLGFRNPELRRYIGMTLAEIAADRQQSAYEAAIDLVIEDGSRVDVAFFLMSEANLLAKLAKPWISFGSDGAAPASEGFFLNANVHPRTYGTFARVLGKYVREEQVLSLPQAVRRLSALPAKNLRIERRGRLLPGFFADITVFDAATIGDRATFEKPHQYAEGVVHVFVNGVQVIAGGEHTDARPGRVVRGPGWSGANATD